MQPGQTAARLHRSHRRLVAWAVIICPLMTGVFFGVISGWLVSLSTGLEPAGAVGALVGGAMFTSNALALCIVQAGATDEDEPRAQPTTNEVRQARAS